MRIYGGHDYYDCALSLGIDPNVVLLRNKQKTVPVSEAGVSLFSQKPEARDGPGATYTLRSVAAAFCGTCYWGVVLTHEKGTENFWSAAKLRDWLNTNCRVGVRVYPPRWSLEEYFNPEPTPRKLREYMIANKYAILVQKEVRGWQEAYFEVNPSTLKLLGFAKALDPYTAFQELSMWIGGVLGGTSPEIAEITDDQVLIENHGFDKKFSFRGPRL